MSFITALVCAQALFVERYDTLNAWATGTWDAGGGTYAYALSATAAHSGPTGIQFSKLDAGTGMFTAGGSLPYPFGVTPPAVHLRYWLRFERGTGEPWLWPLQVRSGNGFALAEAFVEPLVDGGTTLVARFSDGLGVLTSGPLRSISPDAWHLVQLDLEGLSTDAGQVECALDGEAVWSSANLDWSSVLAPRLYTGFPITHDAWVGGFAMDDLLVLSERRAMRARLFAPSTIATDDCVPFSADFSDVDGGPLSVPDVSIVTLSVIGAATVYSDTLCTSAATAGFTPPGPTFTGAVRASAPGNFALVVDSPDLIGAGVVIRAIGDGGVSDAGVSDAGVSDAGVSDAGVSDAGVSDAGTVDAGPPDASVGDAGRPDAGVDDVRLYTVGCGCSASPWPGLLVLLLWVARRYRR